MSVPVCVQTCAAAAAAPPRRVLSDITNISPLRLPTPPRRTQSNPSASSDARPTHSHLSPLERYAVAVLTMDGQKQKDVAVKVGCSPKAVRVWSQRIGEDEDAEDSQRSGRPKLLHSSTMDALIDAATAAPKASTPRELKHKFDLSCSAKTIRRVLDDAGLFGRIARVIPPQNPRITQLRLSFAQGYANFDWTLVLWSDEMSIRIGPQGQTWVQRPIGEAFDPQYCVEKEKHAPKVHVWGCMAAAGTGNIHVFTENLDAVLMKKILKEHLMKSANKFWPKGLWHFQQDNDPKHTSRLVSDYLERELCIKDYIIKWPPYSPDLNPIENLWADLKKRVERHNCTNVKELEAAVKTEWAATDKNLCQKLVASMPDRIARLLEYHGAPTGY